MRVARAGEVLENPVTGERIVFHRTSAETNGELLEYELTVRPAGFLAQNHLHSKQEERHEVVEGEVAITIAGHERVLRPGDVEIVPPGTAHRLRAVSDQPVRLRMESRPALNSERLIETFVALARDGKVNRKGFPSPLQLAVISRDFEDEGYTAKPPLAVQRIVFGPLAALGRLRGYRGTYPA